LNDGGIKQHCKMKEKGSFYEEWLISDKIQKDTA